MAKLKAKQRIMRVPHSAIGSSPGILVINGNAPRPKVSVLSYGPTDLYEEDNITDLKSLCSLVERFPVTWINVDGLGDAGVLNELGALFGIHRLALEDVVNVPQRPKIEAYDEDLFVVMRMVLVHEDLEFEQVSLYLGKKVVLTFHEGRLEDNLGPVRDRIHKSIYRIRGVGPDYLAYAVIDAVIDGYFPVLEDYSERLEALEEKVLKTPGKDMVTQIHDMRRDLLTVRRGMWPLREALSALLREPPAIIAVDTRPFLRDCADHAGQILDLIESERDLCSGMMDVYLSSASNRMNEIMKFLTMMSAIFIPLSFIAGIYGMNFDPDSSTLNMPELRWLYGYPFTLTLMAIIAGALMVFFKRKGWI